MQNYAHSSSGPSTGQAVSLSAGGETLGVGGPFDFNRIGTTWVFRRTNRSESYHTVQGVYGKDKIEHYFQGQSQPSTPLQILVTRTSLGIVSPHTSSLLVTRAGIHDVTYKVLVWFMVQILDHIIVFGT